MPPAVTPETKPAGADLEAVQEQLRQLRREQRTMKRDYLMKISELEGTVQRLIDISLRMKAPPDGSTGQPDDPAVEKLNQRILDAIAILEGTGTTPPPPAIDPNAPATPVD